MNLGDYPLPIGVVFPPGFCPPGYVCPPGGGTATSPLYIGQTAYNQIITKFYDLKGINFTPQFPGGNYQMMMNYWLTNNATDLQNLSLVILPLAASQVLGMLIWLNGVEPGRTWTPSEMITLIDKLILKQNASFPEIEIPARVMRFLCDALRVTVTGPQEQVLQDQRKVLRSQEYTVMENILDANSALALAIKETSKGSTLTSSYQTDINLAQQNLNGLQDQLSAVRSQILAVSSQLVNIQTTPLTHDQLAQFLITNLPVSPIQKELSDAWNQVQGIITQSGALLAPNQAAVAQITASIVPYRLRVQAAQAAYNSNPNDVNTAQLAYAKMQIQPFYDQLTQLNYQFQQIVKAHPEFYPNGQSVTDPAILAKMVDNSILEAANTSPEDLITITDQAMKILSSDCDARSNALIAERDAAIAERQNLFQKFVEDKIEVEMKYYQDQMKDSQDGYNDLASKITTMVNLIQALQDEMSANFQALGQIIGWWTHIQNLSAAQLAHPSFINSALNAVSRLNGGYDTVVIPGPLGMSSTQVFWSGPGASADLASHTLNLMQQLQSANDDYQMNEPALQSQMETIKSWMENLQTAWKMTSDKINSPEYVQQATLEFNTDPMNALLQTDIDAVTTPLREISVVVQTHQQTLHKLLEDIEMDALNQNGINFYDPSVLSYTDKKHAWFGVDEFLEKSEDKLPLVQQTIQDITTRINSGGAQDDDPGNLAIAKQGVLNIMAAQLLYRKLSDDIDFQMALKEEAETESKKDVAAAGGLQ